MFAVYCYFAIAFIMNIKNITDYVNYIHSKGNYQVKEENIILYKYLLFTEIDLHSKCIVAMQAYVEGLIKTFLGADFLREQDDAIPDTAISDSPEPEPRLSLIYKFATGELNYPIEVYQECIGITGYDRIGIYNKVLTNYAILKFNEISKENWVTTGDVCPDMIIMESDNNSYFRKQNPVEAMYAVAVEGKTLDPEADVSNGYLVEVDDENQDMDASTVLDVLDPDNENTDSPEETDLFYVKLPGYANQGYIKFTEEIPDSFTYKIEDLLNANYITTYVKPAWRSEINKQCI